MLSRLLQPPDKEDQFRKNRVADAEDVDVYFVGAGEVWPSDLGWACHVGSVVSTHDSNLMGMDPELVLKTGEK